MQASAIKITAMAKFALLNIDSTPLTRQSDRCSRVCPGRPFASASFGDDPFPHSHSFCESLTAAVLMMRRTSIHVLFRYKQSNI